MVVHFLLYFIVMQANHTDVSSFGKQVVFTGSCMMKGVVKKASIQVGLLHVEISAPEACMVLPCPDSFHSFLAILNVMADLGVLRGALVYCRA